MSLTAAHFKVKPLKNTTDIMIMSQAYYRNEDYSSASLTSDELTEDLLRTFERGHQLEEMPPSRGFKAERRKEQVWYVTGQ